MNEITSSSRKTFGLWSATFLVVANMIGAGVFATSGLSLADLGNRKWVVLAWFVGGVVAICGAISYGQLARRITESGGEYLFLSRMVHPAVGFLAGWVSLLAGFTGAIAFVATTFEEYAVPVGSRPDWLPSGTIGIATILFFGLLHSTILRFGVMTQNGVVVLKIGLLLLFLAAAFWLFPANWDGLKLPDKRAPFSLFAFASALVWISLSFSGFNAAVYISDEVQDARKNVPRAMLLGTLLVSLLYLALNFCFVYGAEPESVSGAPDVAQVAALAIGGEGLAILIRLVAGLALLSSVSSMIVAGPRVYAKMAEDGVFPKCFRWSRQHGEEIPAAAIWLQVGCASAMVYFTTIYSLLDYLGFTLSVSAALTVACIFWNRRAEEGQLARLYFRIVALLYVSATLGLAGLSLVDRPQQLIGFAVTVASGLAIYFFSRSRSD